MQGQYFNPMPAYRELCDFEKGRIVGMLEAGWSQAAVAKHLGRSRSVIQTWWKRWQHKGNVDRRQGRGRHRLIKTERENHVRLLVRRHRFTPYTHMWQSSAYRSMCSLRTFQRTSLRMGFQSHRPVVCIPLTPEHRQRRLSWCPEDWRKIVHCIF